MNLHETKLSKAKAEVVFTNAAKIVLAHDESKPFELNDTVHFFTHNVLDAVFGLFDFVVNASDEQICSIDFIAWEYRSMIDSVAKHLLATADKFKETYRDVEGAAILLNNLSMFFDMLDRESTNHFIEFMIAFHYSGSYPQLAQSILKKYQYENKGASAGSVFAGLSQQQRLKEREQADYFLRHIKK